MQGIELKNGCLFYYGSPIGYQEKDGLVADPSFRREELEQWLGQRNMEVKWVDGVYDRLSSGGLQSAAEGAAPLKSCRIWQLKRDADIGMRFIPYDQLLREYGEPNRENYDVVFDGQLENYDLEFIWFKFNEDHPSGFTGHSLSISDVVELYDGSGGSFFYVDRFGFQEISFEPPQQTQGMTMTFSSP